METIKSLLLFGRNQDWLRKTATAFEKFPSRHRVLTAEVSEKKEMMNLIQRQMTHVIFIDAPVRQPDLPDLVLEIRSRSPRTIILLHSENPSTQLIVRSMQAGAFDFFDQEATMRDIIKALRRAVGLATFEVDRNQPADRRIYASLERYEKSLALTPSGEAGSSIEKGRSLEQLALALFGSVEGWDHTELNSRPDRSEEIDIVVFNGSVDPFWRRRGDIFLVECKNVGSAIGPPDFSNFFLKVDKRGPECRLGFLIARQIAGTVKQYMDSIRGRSSMVVALDSSCLSELVSSVDRAATLRKFVTQTTLGKPTWNKAAAEPSNEEAPGPQDDEMSNP